MSAITLYGSGTEKVSGFIINSNNPLDIKEWVADETDRLAMAYPYFGLLTRQGDTDQVYRYIGDYTTNLAGDWELVTEFRYGATTPATSLGNIGDTYLAEDTKVFYKKTGVATWTEQFSFDGSQIYTGSGVPDDGSLGVNGDAYFDDNGDVYRKETGAWSLKFNIRGTNGTSDRYATTSTTSQDLDTIGLTATITVETGLSYTAGQSVIVASRAAPTVDFLTATVSGYVTGTGVLSLAAISANGTLAHTDWDVNLSGAEGKEGKAFIFTEGDITLSAAKVSTVEGGSYTPQSPYNASVLIDSRTNTGTPSALLNSMVSHSISYDGTSWYDNGLWRGAKGNTGSPGSNGSNGSNGIDGKAITRLYQFTASSGTFTIETETVEGFYEIRLIVANTTSNVTVRLPDLTSNLINYNIVVHTTKADTVYTVQIRSSSSSAYYTFIPTRIVSAISVFQYSHFVLNGIRSWDEAGRYSAFDAAPSYSVIVDRFISGRRGSSDISGTDTNFKGLTGLASIKSYPSLSVHPDNGKCLIKAVAYVYSAASNLPVREVYAELHNSSGLLEKTTYTLPSSATSYGSLCINIEAYVPDGNRTFTLKISANNYSGLSASLDCKYSAWYSTSVTIA
jgi:hypothetical protein